MDGLTVDRVLSIFQNEYKTTPITDVFNETYDQLCQVGAYFSGFFSSFWWGGGEEECDDIFYCFFFQSSLEFFEAKGFGSLPQVLVNGAQISMDSVSQLLLK